MKPKRKPMTYGGGIAEATDWADLGRRIRVAAVEAAKLRILPTTHIRGKVSAMRHPRSVEIEQG